MLREEGRTEEAERCIRESLEIKERTKDKEGIAWSLSEIGRLDVEVRRDHRSAARHYGESIQIARELRAKLLEAHVLRYQGMLASDLSRYKTTGEYFQKSYDILQSASEKQELASTLFQWGLLEEKRGHYIEAAKLLSLSVEHFQGLDNRNSNQAAEAFQRVNTKMETLETAGSTRG